MALIKCPECGGDMSTTLKQCIHCGCKISVCPDCGSVVAGEISVCPKCGTDNKNGNLIESEKPGSEEVCDGTTLYNKWIKDCPTSSAMIKKEKLISVLIKFLIWVPAFIGSWIFFDWRDDKLQMLVDFQNILRTLRCLFILFTILFLCFPAEKTLNIIFIFRLLIWLKQNMEISDAVKKQIISSTVDGKDLYSKFIVLYLEAVVLCENKQSRYKYLLICSINFAVRIVATVGLSIFIYYNILNIMQYTILDKSWGFSDLSHLSGLFIGGAGIVIVFIWEIICIDLIFFNKSLAKLKASITE